MTARRTKEICIRLTQDEKDTLDSITEAAGISASELIRSVVIHRTIDLPPLRGGLNKKLYHDNSERTEEIKIRLTPKEKQLLEEKATAIGCTVSELVRRAAVRGEIKTINFDIGLMKQYIHELLKQGTNLNQLVYFINARGNKAFDAAEVESVMDKIYASVDRADDFLMQLEEDYYAIKDK